MFRSAKTILFFIDGYTPDSAFIALSSSASNTTAADGSYLWVDNLGFTGTVPNGVISIPNLAASIEVFPNPATGSTSVYYRSSTSGEVSVFLTDMAGRTIRSFKTKTVTGENDIPLDLTGVAQGLYIIKLANENGTAEKKLFVE